MEQLGPNSKAAASFAEALTYAPNNPELLLKVGVHQLVAGDEDQAIRLLSHALKLLPQDGDTLYYLAQAYHLKGDNDLALETITRCLHVQPNEPFVWQKYGELLCSSGDYEAALLGLGHCEVELKLCDGNGIPGTAAAAGSNAGSGSFLSFPRLHGLGKSDGSRARSRNAFQNDRAGRFLKHAEAAVVMSLRFVSYRGESPHLLRLAN